jgi:hypothetical protein
MVAIYPTALKSFAYRQDFTELVEAADINVAYDEIGAVESTLGVLPNSDTLDGSTVTWPTVKANISAARNGVTKPICKLRTVDTLVPYGGPSGTGIYAAFNSAIWDTHGMWQGGSTIICPRTGWYNFQFYAEWQYAAFPFDNSVPQYEHSGYASVGLQQLPNSLYITGSNHFVSQGAQFAIRSSGSISAPWFKGTSLSAQLAQTVRSSSSQPCNLYLSITYERDAPTTNNM